MNIYSRQPTTERKRSPSTLYKMKQKRWGDNSKPSLSTRRKETRAKSPGKKNQSFDPFHLDAIATRRTGEPVLIQPMTSVSATRNIRGPGWIAAKPKGEYIPQLCRFGVDLRATLQRRHVQHDGAPLYFARRWERKSWDGRAACIKYVEHVPCPSAACTIVALLRREAQFGRKSCGNCQAGPVLGSSARLR